MPAPKRVSWRAERRDLGALGFTNATTPRPSDAAAEQSSFTQQQVSELLAASAFAACNALPDDCPQRQQRAGSTADKAYRVFRASLSPPASGKRFKTQDHNFSSDSIKAEQGLVEGRTHAVRSPRRRSGESKSVTSRPKARVAADRRQRLLRAPQTAPPHACDECMNSRRLMLVPPCQTNVRGLNQSRGSR